MLNCEVFNALREARVADRGMTPALQSDPAALVVGLWEAARETEGGRAFLVWLMPLRTNEAAEGLLQGFASLRERLLLAPTSLLEGPPVEVDPLVRPALQRSLRAVAPVDRLNRAMREYRQHRRARTTAVLRSPNDLAQLVASGAVFRLDPGTPVSHLRKTPENLGITALPWEGKWTVGRPTGAGEGIRTLDPDLGKVVLYP